MSEDQKTKPPGERRTVVTDKLKPHDDEQEQQVEAELLAMLDAVLADSRGQQETTTPTPPRPKSGPAPSQGAPATTTPRAEPDQSRITRTRSEVAPRVQAVPKVPMAAVPPPTAHRSRTISGQRMMFVAIGILAILVSWAIVRWVVGRAGHAPPASTGVVSVPSNRPAPAPPAPADRETPREAAPGHDIATTPGRTEAPPVSVQPGQPVQLKPAPRPGSSESPAAKGAISARPLAVPDLSAPVTTIPAPGGGLTGAAPKPSEPVTVPVPGKEPEPGGTERAAGSALIREETAIRETLHQYQNAYEQLNARAAAVVWPSVDEKALAKAFSGLASYDLVFERCDVTVGPSTATALCRGRATYVPKIGRSIARVEPRQWTFNLKNVDSEWKIETVEGSR